MGMESRHPSFSHPPHRGPSAPGSSASGAPGKAKGKDGPTALEFAHLAASLAPSVGKPANECFGEARQLLRHAEMWLAGIDEHGPRDLYEHGEEPILESEASL